MTNSPPALHNTIINGDCVSVLPQLDPGSVNFILTDPPYVARYKSRDGRTVPNDDNFAWLKPAFTAMYRILKRDSFCVSFYGWPNAHRFVEAYHAAGFHVVGHFVFPKHYTSGKGRVRYQHECAYLLAKGRPPERAQLIGDVIPWRTYTHNRLHPTQKPLAILTPLIEAFSDPGDLVLDPFTGSGSSLLAAKKLGRSWLGIELDARYHAIASERLVQPA
jgi:site-specific DNA-methyltransferase (adenine-specific)